MYMFLYFWATGRVCTKKKCRAHHTSNGSVRILNNLCILVWLVISDDVRTVLKHCIARKKAPWVYNLSGKNCHSSNAEIKSHLKIKNKIKILANCVLSGNKQLTTAISSFPKLSEFWPKFFTLRGTVTSMNALGNSCCRSFLQKLATAPFRLHHEKKFTKGLESTDSWCQWRFSRLEWVTNSPLSR